MKLLSKKTYYNKRIPKQKFYDNIDIPSEVKKIFVENVLTIHWKNKLSSTTINVEQGKSVTEIEVFQIKLKTKEINEIFFKQIDKQIPYHIVFILEYENKYQLWIGYKVNNLSKKNSFTVNQYYHTDWLEYEEINLRIEGTNLDSVYENFILQVAGENLKKENSEESLKEAVERENKKQALLKQINSLKSKIRKEKQFNKQVEMNTELKKLKKELDIL